MDHSDCIYCRHGGYFCGYYDTSCELHGNIEAFDHPYRDAKKCPDYTTPERAKEIEDSWAFSEEVLSEKVGMRLDKFMILEACKKYKAVPKYRYNGFRCICGQEVAKNQRYCEYCGQKLLDWED